MKRVCVFKAVACAFLLSSVVAKAEEKTKEEWHCEKTKDGKTSEIEATSKDDCKKKGGKWSKAHDEHKEGDGHKHD